jgi:hypothetical protein
MDAHRFREFVGCLAVGKRLPTAVYVHAGALESLDGELKDFLQQLCARTGVQEDEHNVVKLFTNEFRLSLLSYPGFFETPHPVLSPSTTIELSSGEIEVPATSLPPEEMPLDDLDLCYELRWGSETGYRHQKSHMHVENFSGRTPQSVMQDYHATVFIQNLAAVLAFPLHAMVPEATAHRKHLPAQLRQRGQGNARQAIRFLGRVGGSAVALVEALVKCVKSMGTWRYGRSSERRKKNPGRKRHTSYKPIS